MEMSEGMMIFLGLIFGTVFLLSQGLMVPVFGEGGKMRKRLKQRLEEIEAEEDDDSLASLLREKHLRKLAPWERSIESLPIFEQLRRTIEQAGWAILPYRFVGVCIGFGLAAAFVAFNYANLWFAGAGGFLVGATLPYLKLVADRGARMAKFEEQLPDAIDSMKRALQAGHPFSACIKLVAEDMEDPIAREFEQTFADINYGNDLRRAMLGLLQRVPSMTVMALVTSVLVQKETGGNLAEILTQISKVVRGRFRFQRKVKTLSAEGRMSAWVLAMVPFVLFAVISTTSPDYLPVLIDDPVGKQLIIGAIVLGFVGIMWIRRIIRVNV